MDVGSCSRIYSTRVWFYLYYWLDWLGWSKVYSCCKYNENPAESEIIINVPLALKIMTTGYIWPISAWQELISGDLVAPKDEITVSHVNNKI
jgi:photosystem I subunit 3